MKIIAAIAAALVLALSAPLTADPLLFVVHPSLPVKTVKDLVAFAKRKPGDMTFSSPGLYSSGHVSMAMLMRAAKINLLHPTTARVRP